MMVWWRCVRVCQRERSFRNRETQPFRLWFKDAIQAVYYFYCNYRNCIWCVWDILLSIYYEIKRLLQFPEKINDEYRIKLYKTCYKWKFKLLIESEFKNRSQLITNLSSSHLDSKNVPISKNRSNSREFVQIDNHESWRV